MVKNNDGVKKFYQINRHSNVNINYITANEVYLGRVVSKIRQNKDKLTIQQLNDLETVNFVYDMNEYKWKYGYAMLINFFNYYHHSNVPFNFKTTDGYALGRWCANQRANWANLATWQKELLQRVDFLEAEKRLKFIKAYELLKKYYEYYKNSLVNINFKTKNGVFYDEDGYSLGIFVYEQMKLYKQGKLSLEHKKLLDDLDFVFARREYNFRKKYALLENFYNYYQSFNIPFNFKTNDGYTYDEDGVNLYSWFRYLQNNFANLPAYQQEKLRELNINNEISSDLKIKK